MSDIASGRARALQRKIVEAIIRAHDIDSLSSGGIAHIFRDLLDDSSIKYELLENGIDLSNRGK